MKTNLVPSTRLALARGLMAAGALALAAAAVLAGSNGPVAAATLRGAGRPVPAGTASPFPFQNGAAWITTASGTDTITYGNSPPTTQPYYYTETDNESCPVAFNGYNNLCADQFLQSSDPNYLTSFLIGYSSQGALGDLVQYGGTSNNQSGGYTASGLWTFSPATIWYVFGGAPGSQFSGGYGIYHEHDATYGPKGYLESFDDVVQGSGAYTAHTRLHDPQSKSNTKILEKTMNGGAAEYDTIVTGANPGSTTETFGKPQNVGGTWTIPVSTTRNGSTTNVDVADWFPGGGPAPKNLQGLEYADEGPVSMPSVCGQYAGAPAEDFRILQDYFLDPSSGVYETISGDYYFVNGIGAVCTPLVWTLSYYYNTTTGGLNVSEQIAYTEIIQSYTFPQALLRGLVNRPRSAHRSGGSVQPPDRILGRHIPLERRIRLPIGRVLQ
jgi:hypothetical protein